MIAHLKTCNKTSSSKTSYADEEMDKAKAFMQKAIETKFVNGPDHFFGRGKFTKKGEFITYFKQPAKTRA